MNFTEKIKRFWTLDVHNHEGFTLVELIIVIAILAILSSVAVVGYSSYVKKANKAADEQLLYAINQAFRSACIENMCDIYDIDAAEWDMATMTVISVQNDANHPIVESFEKYFDVANPQFKVIEDLYFDSMLHAFTENANVTIRYNGVDLVFTSEQIAALKNSSFMNEELGLGLDALLGKLDFTTNFAQALLGDGENTSEALAAVVADPIFHEALISYLGLTVTDLNDDGVIDATDNALAIGAWGEANPDNQAAVMSNALVLYAAQNSTMTVEEATAILTGDAKSSILATLNGTNGSAANTPAAMAQAAMAYGMYTSYAHYTRDQELIDKAASPNALDVMNMLNDPAFKTYIESPQGQKDLEGYLSAMNMIDTAAGNSDVATGVLTNGFTDEELADVLDQALGQG